MLALMVAGISQAQQGTLLVGGNIGFSSDRQEAGSVETKSDLFYFSPRVGYQFTENLTAGVTASLENSEATDMESRTFKVGPFVRYARSLGDSGLFSVYADLDMGYQSARDKTGMGATDKYNGLYANLTPALFINFKKGFGLNFSIGGLGYNSLTHTDNSDVKRSGFDFNFGKTVNIGISKNFNL